MARAKSVKRKISGTRSPFGLLGEILSGLAVALFLVSVAIASHTADLTGDGKIDTSDLAIVKSQWRSTGTADLNHDGTVNARDAGILFSSWGTTLGQPFEAESGTLVAPMATVSHPDASGGASIASSVANAGTAAFSVNVPVAGTYYLWGRILAPTSTQDSFFVSMDGGTEQAFYLTTDTFSTSFQWAKVNDGTRATRVFTLSAGPHTLTIRGREANTGLDQLILTNDPNFVPPGGTVTPPQPPSTTRDPALWPFTTQSVFNYPVGSGAIYTTPQPATESGPYVMTYAGFNGIGSGGSRRFSKNVWIARPSDSIKKLFNGSGVLQYQIRVHPDAVQAEGTDGDIVLVTDDHLFAYEAGRASKDANGDWHAGSGLRWWEHNLKGSGIYSSFHSSDAWGNAAFGGLVRRGEFETGIRHALQVSIYTKMLNGGPDGTTAGKVWPANTRDKPAVYGTNGNLYLGTLLAIPPELDVVALATTPATHPVPNTADPRAIAILRAMQDYGVYFTTVNLSGGPVFMADGAALDYFALPARSIGSDTSHPFWYGLSQGVQKLKVITNNTPTSIGGGGTPRVPLAPPFDR